MDIIESNNTDILIENSVVVLGNFDGVHLGHKYLIEQAKRISTNNNLPLILVTFEPHPISLFRTDIKNYRLTNLEHKRNLLKNLSVDYLLEIKFDLEFSKMTANDFVANILFKKLKAKHIVIGYDFVFGNNKQGNGDFLKEKSCEYKYKLHQIAALGQGEIYSSTLIRSALKNGNTAKAKQFLGRNYSIKGKIIKGKQLGRTIGFPTINVSYSEYLLPQNGVYSAKVTIENNTYNGVLNIGLKPSLGSENITLEMHIFDFNSDVYDKYVEIEFLDKIRDEVKFNSLNDLKKQITSDCKIAKSRIAN